MRSKTAILTVTGKDRTGIISNVTKVLYQQGCNLEDVSMTILEGEFAMILIVRFAGRHDQIKIMQLLRKLGKKWQLSIFWKDLNFSPTHGEREPKNCRRYLVTAIGKDQTGIVYKISDLLAKYRLNITDLNSRILGQGTKTLYALMLEVDIPNSYVFKKIEKSIKGLQRKLKIEIGLKPMELIEC